MKLNSPYSEIFNSRDKIFNLMIRELCVIKGLEFLTSEEYNKFEEKSKKIIEHELFLYVARTQ